MLLLWKTVAFLSQLLFVPASFATQSPLKLAYAELVSVEEMVFPVGCIAKNGGLLDKGHIS